MAAAAGLWGEGARRVQIPYFPEYSTVRHLLPVWEGRPRKQATGLHSTLAGLRGTPQQPMDWTCPDEWIEARLSGDDRDLARAVWTRSGGSVNPRYTDGAWLLVQRYGFFEDDASGLLRLTERGRDFLEHPGGATEETLDELEGVRRLLEIVAELGPARSGELFEPWSEYMARHSNYKANATRKSTLHRRLVNLLERELIVRRSVSYSVTEAGLAYLNGVVKREPAAADERPEIWALIHSQEQVARAQLHALLFEMDPFALEHLVGRLLDEMGYQNVEVTSRSGDGGVDVIAEIELGISSVREVVQVKRYKKTSVIQRKELDALRGSLYRFGAVRGTIVTTSSFSQGTINEAFAPGAAPITLIDGEKLVDLLIQHEIGVRKRVVELLEVDPDGILLVDEDA